MGEMDCFQRTTTGNLGIPISSRTACEFKTSVCMQACMQTALSCCCCACVCLKREQCSPLWSRQLSWCTMTFPSMHASRTWTHCVKKWKSASGEFKKYTDTTCGKNLQKGQRRQCAQKKTSKPEAHIFLLEDTIHVLKGKHFFFAKLPLCSAGSERNESSENAEVLISR